VNTHLNLTEGFHSWIHMHGITMLPALHGKLDVNLSGWDGGSIMGFLDTETSSLVYALDDDLMTTELYRYFCFLFTWPGLTDAEERMLYTPGYHAQMIGRAYESMAAEFAPYKSYRMENKAEYFYLDSQCLRMTINMLTVARSHLEVRAPFWDYDLIDTIYAFKPDLRANKILYRDIITRETPRLALIPYDREEYLPSVNPILHNPHKTTLRILRRLRLHPERPTLYADYENYLRQDLRQWAEDLLYDPRTESRGIFSPSFVRSLLHLHMSGTKLWTIGKVASLITLEMVLRRYFD